MRGRRAEGRFQIHEKMGNNASIIGGGKLGYGFRFCTPSWVQAGRLGEAERSEPVTLYPRPFEKSGASRDTPSFRPPIPDR